MPDILQLPSTPAAAPPAATDVILIARPAPPGSPSGTPGEAFGVALGDFTAAVLSLASPNAYATATGADAPSAALLEAGAVNIVTGGSANSGVRLPAAAGNASLAVLNALAVPILVYPPILAATTARINGSAAGQALPPGSETTLRTVDGITWFAGA